MRVPMIAGNWKMNTTVSEAVKLVGDMRQLYQKTFNHPCCGSSCYYETAMEKNGG